MNITSITEEKNGVLILVNGDYEYFIPQSRYDENYDGVSGWIQQISEKTWSDIESIYRLGSIISKYTKYSRIDWKATFFLVEKSFFIDKIIQQRKESQIKNNWKRKANQSFDNILLMKELSSLELNKEIEKITNAKLKTYGIK